MSMYDPLGKYLDKQKEAAEILQNEGPLSHETLRSRLGLEEQRDVMQAVIRGLSDNGLLKSITDETGHRKYNVEDDYNIERVYNVK